MTDRELLEMAAKASRTKLSDSPQVPWNPIRSDGEALRLAVRMKMLIEVTHEFASAQAPNAEFCTEPCGSDAFAATRRAIVRAAAAFGAKK